MAKSAPKQSSLDTSNFLPSLLILGFLLVGFIPNIDAVDKIAPQWLVSKHSKLIVCAFFFFSTVRVLRNDSQLY